MKKFFQKFARKLVLSFGFVIPVTGLNIEEELVLNKDLSGSYKLHTWYEAGLELAVPNEVLAKAYPNKAEYQKAFAGAENLKCDEQEDKDKGEKHFTMSFDFKDIKQLPVFAGITLSEDKDGNTIIRKIEFSEANPDKTMLNGFSYKFNLTVPDKVLETIPKGADSGWSMADLSELVGVTELKLKYAKAQTAAPAEGGGTGESGAPAAGGEQAGGAEDKKTEGMSTGLIIGIGVGVIAVIGAVVFIIMKKKKAKEQQRLARLQAEEEGFEEEGGVPARPSSRFRKPTTKGNAKGTSARFQRPVGRPGAKPSARPSAPPPIDIEEEQPPQEQEEEPPQEEEQVPPQPAPRQVPKAPVRPSAQQAQPASDELKIIQCPTCQTKLKVKASLKGKAVLCAKCKNKMIVP